MSGGMGNGPNSLSAALHNLRMQVNPSNVMQIHHGLQAEALLIDAELQINGYPARVGVAADEAVSKMAATGFNGRIQDLVREVKAFKDGLQAAADEVRAQAIRYGHTEQEIKQSFDKYQADYR